MKKCATPALLQSASKRKRGSSDDDDDGEEELMEVDLSFKKPAQQETLPGKNEDMDFGEMLSLDDDEDSYNDDGSDEEEEDPKPPQKAPPPHEQGTMVNSRHSSSSSICTDDDVVQKKKKRNVRGLLALAADDEEDHSSKSDMNSRNSYSSSDDFEDEGELEDLFDETLEELQAMEAKQQQHAATAAAAAKKTSAKPQQRTLEVLRKVPFFAQFSSEHQEQLFSELEEDSFTDGVNIVNQGDLGDKFYVIVSGEAVVSKADDNGEFRDLTHIYTGDFFGELVLIYGGQRVATVTSVGRTKCMSLSKKAFEKYADIRYFLILQKVPLLAGLTREVQLEIVRRLKPAKFNQDELVVKQHDKGDAFFFITRGSALVVDEDDGDRVITRLYEGHSFGEMALLSDAPRVASVRSSNASELHCMFLSVQDFKELLSAEDFALLVEKESKKIRELRDKRTLFKQMRASSNNSIDVTPSPSSILFDSNNNDEQRPRSVSQQLKTNGSNSPGPSPCTPRTAGMQQKLKTGKTLGGSRIINNYVLLEQIGKGTFGIVRLCENAGNKYAIKIIDKSLFKNKISSKHQSTIEDMRREASIMKKLNHPNVVNLIDVIDDPKAEQLYLVQEYCAGGAVMENLEGSQPLDEQLARKYFRDLLCGIDYLHAHQIVHRDIKPMNLLITSTGLLKIGDFGAARVLSNDSKQTLGIAGTPAFMAPELLGQEASLYDGPAVDLWSCGATLFMLVTGVPPWMASDELTLAKRVQNDELIFPGAFATKLNPHLRNLLTGLLVKDPAQRMTLTQTMVHEWVTEEGAEPLERFVNLQPQLIRVNSKRLMSPPRQASPASAHATALSTTPPPPVLARRMTSSSSTRAAAAVAAEYSDSSHDEEDEDEDDDGDDEDAITILNNDGSSQQRKRYADSPSSPVMRVGDDMSNMFSLSPPAIAEQQGVMPQLNIASATLERTDSLDYAQIDVGRGCMTNANNPTAAQSTDTMYTTSSGSNHKLVPSTSSLSFATAATAASSTTCGNNKQQRKKEVVDAFNKQRHGLKRPMGSMSSHNRTSSFGESQLLGKRSIASIGGRDSPSTRKLQPSAQLSKQSSILSFLDNSEMEEVEEVGEYDDEDDKSDNEVVAAATTEAFVKHVTGADVTIQPLPPNAPEIIKARRGSLALHCRVKYGYGEVQGLRSSMEDFIAIVPRLKNSETFYAAVFDGHGGDRVAKELKARLHRALSSSPDFAADLPTAIKKTCLAIDRAMLHYAATELLDMESKVQLGDQQKSLFRTKGGGSKHLDNAGDMFRKTGSTAVMALVRGTELIVGWVGDSRAVLCRAGKAVQLSEDHKAEREDEKQRIRANGGTVDRRGRVYGDLAVSRAFGDLQHKGRELSAIVAAGASGPEEFYGAEGTLIALPDVTSVQLTHRDEFVILASDGIWDVMSNEEAVNFVRFHLHKHGDVRKAALELVDKALEMHSLDNASAVVLAFVGK